MPILSTSGAIKEKAFFAFKITIGAKTPPSKASSFSSIKASSLALCKSLHIKAKGFLGRFFLSLRVFKASSLNASHMR